MLLHTPLYLVFLLAVVLIYWLLPRLIWRKAFLLVASYLFYAMFDWRFALLLFILTLISFVLGKAIERGKSPRGYVWLSVIINICVLIIFKLSGFFINSLESMLQIIGLNVFSPGLTLLLPVGISFYTFQAISYTTDIYRHKIQPTSSLVDFGLYLAFFPKLIAGPLVRPAIFLNQVYHPKASLSKEEYLSALGLLLLGLAKKVIIADSLAGRADVAFRAAAFPVDGMQFASPIFIQGFYLYAFQIYADFSGYTDIARASAALLGFTLPENFQQPYLSSTITSFWNRWHMSLTQWFREFLFFPFSRALLFFTHRRQPRIVQISANLLTMILIGLWHGMAWTFVAWGLLAWDLAFAGKLDKVETIPADLSDLFRNDHFSSGRFGVGAVP